MRHEKKKTRVKSDDQTITKKIESTALVKKYTDSTWKRLAGITTSEVATRLSRGKGVPSNSDNVISESINELLKRIDQFLPMVLWSGTEATPYRNQNHAWQVRLMKIAEYVGKDAKPVYLIDEVNKLLRRESAKQIATLKEAVKDIYDAQETNTPLTQAQKDKLASVRQQIRDIKSQYICTPLILKKYIHLQYKEGMKIEELVPLMSPSTIAEFITKNSGTVWEYLPVKMDPVKYSVRVDKKCTWKAADIARRIEIPYACPSIVSARSDWNLLQDIKNDIAVLDEYIEWYQSAGSLNLTDEYQKIYSNYISRLKTLRISIDTFKQKNDKKSEVANKKDENTNVPSAPSSPTPLVKKDEAYEAAKHRFNSGHTLDESDQLAILRHGKCPSCGKDVKEIAAGIRANGSTYAAFIACSGGTICKFTAGGTIQAPQINRDKQITPREDREALS